MSVATVDRWARTGQLTAHRVGKAWRFHREDVLEFLGAEAAS